MSSSKPKKILVVDDELDIIDMLESLLETEGYEVVKADSGAKAIELLEAMEQKPDLMLLDIMMPDKDGHSVLKQVREKYDESTVPILMVTARNDVVDIGQGLDEGVNGFVVKPFETENLLRTIHGTLESDPVSFYANYERVAGVTSRKGTGYQQGERIIFLDLEEADPDADIILEALDVDGVYLMSILQFDVESEEGERRQSSVLVTAENGICFGAFLNRLLSAGSITVAACQIYKDPLDLPHDLMAQGREYTFEE